MSPDVADKDRRPGKAKDLLTTAHDPLQDSGGGDARPVQETRHGLALQQRQAVGVHYRSYDVGVSRVEDLPLEDMQRETISECLANGLVVDGMPEIDSVEDVTQSPGSPRIRVTLRVAASSRAYGVPPRPGPVEAMGEEDRRGSTADKSQYGAGVRSRAAATEEPPIASTRRGTRGRT